MEMKYSLGWNFDPEVIEFLAENDKKHQIESVFAKLKDDIIGGGRASNVLPALSSKELRKSIELCNKHNIHFNYLLNPMCLGNRELNPSEHRKILNFIDEICDMGIYSVTVNSPYLCELIKERYPNIKVTIGLYALIYSLQQVKYWESLGADELTLHHRVNRNFDELRRMLEYTKHGDMKLRVIANNVCLHDCPYQINHGCGQSHASQEKDNDKCIYLDYNLLRCNYGKISSPSALIASEWIRPEDVHYYGQICDEVGNHNFSIKLLERTKTTEFLKRVITAYLSEKYDGNLIDILTWGTKKNTQSVDLPSLYKKAITARYDIPSLKRYEKVFDLPPVNIDNRSLDGFLEKFWKEYSCDKCICGANDDTNDGFARCTYCKSWAEKAVSCNEEERQAWITLADTVLGDLRRSRFFGVK